MASRGLLYLTLRRRPWFVYLVCAFVALVPVIMWQQRYADVRERTGRDTVSVQVVSVTDQGNDDLVTAILDDERITFTYPGSVAKGDRVEVFRSDSRWVAAELAPLWVPIAATALLWVPVAFVIWRYPIMARGRGWTRRRDA
ncbi:MAG: hypothetical protein ABJH68_11795 [Ilumatobacter sp.]|uniref:hypothetical protein n=1 Tax=Ilumatobacter sp. TaxID=1967498 RepID=UPI00329A4EC7